MRRSGGGGKKVAFRRCLDQHCPKKLFLPQPQGFVMSLLPSPTQQTKLNSHKNLCKAVNLDQIGFDLSANEISAPDRSFVIDSVLDRGTPDLAGYGPGTMAYESQNMTNSKCGKLRHMISWPRAPCLA